MAKQTLVPSLARIVKNAEDCLLLFQQDTSGPKRIDWLVDMTRLLNHVFKKVDPEVLLQVLRAVFNQARDESEKVYLARFLAANERYLEQGIPTVPGYIPVMGKPHWCHWRIKELKPTNDKVQHEVIMEGLSGYVAMTTLVEYWKPSRCSFVARELGFSKPWGKIPYRRYDHLHGLIFIADTQTVVQNGRRLLKLDPRKCNSGSLKYNQEVLAVRLRAGKDCPRGYQWECHQCVFGLDQCPAAVRARTLEAVVCSKCGSQGWQDYASKAIQGCTCSERKPDVAPTGDASPVSKRPILRAGPGPGVPPPGDPQEPRGDLGGDQLDCSGLEGPGEQDGRREEVL